MHITYAQSSWKGPATLHTIVHYTQKLWDQMPSSEDTRWAISTISFLETALPQNLLTIQEKLWHYGYNHEEGVGRGEEQHYRYQTTKKGGELTIQEEGRTYILIVTGNHISKWNLQKQISVAPVNRLVTSSQVREIMKF